MNRIEELKYKAFAGRLRSNILTQLDLDRDSYNMTVNCTFEGTDAIMHMTVDSAFPPVVVEYSERLPPIHIFEDVERKLSNSLAACLNGKLRHAIASKHVEDSDYVIILVDGNNLAHRARHVYKLSYQGRNVSILYGVLRSLATLYKKYSPYRIVVCFDGGIPASRRELVPSYKINRHVDDADDHALTSKQIDELLLWLPKFGIFTSQAKGYEADDLIAAWVNYLPTLYSTHPMMQDQKLLIVSGDKDMYQLVDNGVDVVDPMAKTLVTLDNFERVTGVPKESYLLYKALVGDESDNIPGIKGIGPILASKLVHNYPTITRLRLGLLNSDSFPTKEYDYIQRAGGIKYILNTLTCIDLKEHVPDDFDLVFFDDITWKAAETELLTLGFVSLVHDDQFRDMVRNNIERHGLVGLK